MSKNPLYMDGLLKILGKLADTNEEKGDSFLLCSEKETIDIVKREWEEWIDACLSETDKEEVEELADLAVSALLRIEWLAKKGRWSLEQSGGTNEQTESGSLS